MLKKQPSFSTDTANNLIEAIPLCAPNIKQKSTTIRKRLHQLGLIAGLGLEIFMGISNGVCYAEETNEPSSSSATELDNLKTQFNAKVVECETINQALRVVLDTKSKIPNDSKPADQLLERLTVLAEVIKPHMQLQKCIEELATLSEQIDAKENKNPTKE